MQGPIFKLYDKDFISKSYLTWSILLDCILYFKFIMCFGNKATLLEAQNFYAYNVMPIETMRSHDIGAEWGTAPSSTAQETQYSWLKSRWSTCSSLGEHLWMYAVPISQIQRKVMIFSWEQGTCHSYCEGDKASVSPSGNPYLKWPAWCLQDRGQNCVEFSTNQCIIATSISF